MGGNVFIAVMGLVLTAVCVALVVRAYRPGSARMARRVDALARASGLAVTDAVAPSVVARVRRDYAGTQVGSVIGLVAGLGIGLAMDRDGALGSDVTLGMLPMAFVGSALGSAIVTVTTARAGADPVRIARSRAVALRDYLGPLERWSARLAPALLVVTVAVVAALPAPHMSGLLAGAVLAGLSVLALILFETVGRVIVRRPQVAPSMTALAWEDALRAMSVRSLADAAIAAGSFGLYVLVLPLLDGAPPAFGLVFALAVVLVLVAVLTVRGRWAPQRHFLARLWPETAAAGAHSRTLR